MFKYICYSITVINVFQQLFSSISYFNSKSAVSHHGHYHPSPGTLSEEPHTKPATVYFLESGDGSMKVVVVFSPQEPTLDFTVETVNYKQLFAPHDATLYHVQVCALGIICYVNICFYGNSHCHVCGDLRKPDLCRKKKFSCKITEC